MKYSAKITGWGPEAFSFLDEEEMNFIVLFDEDAPPELGEISVLHTKASMLEEPKVGDVFKLCGKTFTITAIGNEALHTLRTLGHCTISFRGGSEAERPGCMMVTGSDVLMAKDVFKGGKIEIYAK